MKPLTGFNRTFQALQHRNYRLFWFGQASSVSGNWMQSVGESWLIYRLTGSAVALGAVSFVALVPVIPISFFGSALIDRMPKRRLVMMTQFALAMTALAWAVMTLTGEIRIWHIVFLTFLEGALGSIDLPARQAFLPELVGPGDLPNSIALNQVLTNLARIVGPALAGVVIARAGEGACFLLNGLSFGPFILSLALMHNLYRRKPKEEHRRTGSVIHGLRYLRQSPSLVWLLATMSVSSLLLLSYLTMMPVFAKDILKAGPEGLGWLMTSVGLGATLGSLWLANLNETKQKRWLVYALVLLPLTIIAFTAVGQLALAVVLALIAGVNTSWMQTIFNTLVQVHVRDDMRGRTMSIYLSLSVGMQKLGGLEVGFLAGVLGVPEALRLGAIASILFSSLALWRKPPELKESVSLNLVPSEPT